MSNHDETEIGDEGYWGVTCPLCGSKECGSKPCEHEVLQHLWCNGDWYGKLPEATRSLEKKLQASLWAFFKAGCSLPVSGGSFALSQLIESAQSGFDDTDVAACDWWTDFREYWYDLVRWDVADGAQRVDHEIGGEMPGPAADTCTFLFFRTPTEDLIEIVARAEDDAAALTRMSNGQQRSFS